MLRYPVTLERDTNGTMRVEFPDVPEANTFGEDADEALMQAVDALESALSMYVEDRRDIPKPSPVRARGKAVILPALTEAKLALYSTMRANRVGKAELARRLNWHLPQVDRLLDLLHASRLDQLEAAFRVLGKRLAVEIREAALRDPCC
ncbi:MAG: type II toxin-antitoxin system HicB family antitoxin [Bryobacteraceae bacterium]